MPVRSLYIFATIALAIFVVALGWYFLMDRVLGTVQVASTNIVNDMGLNGTNYTNTNTFLTNLIQYFLVIFLFILGYWVYSQSQKPKGVYYPA